MYEIVNGVYVIEDAGYGRPNFREMAYLVKTDSGNVLFNVPENLDQEIEEVRSHGGVRVAFVQEYVPERKYLELLKTNFNTKIVCHESFEYQVVKKFGEPPDITYRKDIDLTRECRVVWTPGHYFDAAALYLNRGKGILFSGCNVIAFWEQPILAWPGFPRHHTEMTRESLRRLLAYDFDAIFPRFSHGAVKQFMTGGKAIIQDILDHFPPPQERIQESALDEDIEYVTVHGGKDGYYGVYVPNSYLGTGWKSPLQYREEIHRKLRD